MGDGLPHPAGARCGHRRRPAGGPLDPLADESLPATLRTGSAIGIDATFPFGLPVNKAGEAAANVCGPALAEHGREYIEVADVPGWKDYDFPELRKRGAA